MRALGRLVLLRDEPHPGDAEDMFRWLNLEEWQYYDEPDVPFALVTREAFDGMRRQPRSSKGLRWQVDTLDGRHIGWVTTYQLDKQASSAYVGICLPEEDTWNQGYGSEAVSLLVDRLHHKMGLQEIRLATWTGNHRMMRCAVKCGFTEVARMPHRAPVSVRGEPLERVEFIFILG